jgi:hypothetical protein
MTTRRHVLALLASAPALASCAPSPDPAAAWRDPGAGESDPRRFALAHAILAPNPHNTQPWLVELDATDGMTLYCDQARRLSFTDPLDRQITLGCGAFLELYRLGANHLGYTPTLTAFPQGEPTPRLDRRPLAHVTLGPRSTRTLRDPLFTQITARRTNRNPYDAARIPRAEDLQLMADAAAMHSGEVAWAIEPARVAHLRDIVWRAFDLEMHTRGALEETYNWLRFGRDEAAKHGDGLEIDAPGISLYHAMGFLDRAHMTDPNSDANKQALEQWKQKIDTAPAFAWLSTQENDDTPTGRLYAGMAYARMNLAATAAGLAIHPWSQGLEEYEAMTALRHELRLALINGENFPHMLVRVGYAAPAAPSVRRGVAPLLR